MSKPLSVLLADSELDFRELLVNDLLLSGVDNVDVVTNAVDLEHAGHGTTVPWHRLEALGYDPI